LYITMREDSPAQFPAGGSPGIDDPAGASVRVAGPSPKPVAARRIPAVHLLVACGLLLAAVVSAGTVGILVDLRDRALAASERELRNTASILAEQTDRAFQAVELMQSGLLERMNALGIASAEDYERAMSGYDVHRMLKDKVGNWPHIGSLTLINSRGKLFNFSRFWPLPDIDVTDRDFYSALKSDAGLNSFMGEPVRNRATGSWTIHLVRKVAGPNGEFLGLVLGAMEMEYFDRYFATIVLGGDSSIKLFRDDGVLLASHPHVESAMTRSPVKSGVLGQILTQVKAGAVQQIARIDGEERVAVAQRLAHYPFAITATNTVAAALAEWSSAAIYISGAAILLLLVIGVVVLLCVRQIKNYEALVTARAEGEQKTQLDEAINNISLGLLMFDTSERIAVCNRRYIEMYGLSPEVVKPGLAFRDLLCHRKEQGTFTGDIDQYHRELRQGLAGKATYSCQVQNGKGRSILIVNQMMANGGWVATHEDITERRQAEVELQRTQVFLNTVIENAPVTVFAKEAKGQRYILVNRAFEELWGVSRHDVIGKTAYDLFPERTADLIFGRDTELLENPGQLIHTTHQVETPRNGSRLVSSRRIAVRGEDGKSEYLLGVIEDVTDRARADERIKYLAHHDLLTGLSNRALFMEKIEEAGARLRRRGETFTVFMLDLDRFKTVNDSLGHPEGDSLLKETARRLKGALRETDVLARLGGDEFAILQAGEANQSKDANALADRIVDLISEPYDINGNKVTIQTSIGIALAPFDGIESGELMKKADLALYRMKSEGRNGYRFFDVQMTADADARHLLEYDLREALSRGELEVHYQPVIDVRTRKPVGVEALVRWRHPRKGFIPPDQFIPLAEETGLIIPLGEFVLLRACTDAASWPEHIKVAVNLSLVQFRKCNLFDVILCALVESGLSPERLELEITESILLENELDILAVIRQLKNLGVSLALDDFGTGYSSLSYLTKFPFDKIKIDKSFTQNLTKRKECAAIIASVHALAVGLDILTTAEGVETEQQFEILRDAGINLIQGYLFGRPRPVSELDFAPVDAPSRVESAA
jgi:diguanylate cyclase (GGDEF)-like protein/PAS domain S-box-containing protein